MPPIRLRAATLGFVATLAALLAPPVQAQRYHAINLDERDGMSSHVVHSMAQHPDGSMWFGVRSRLLRYDGQQFEPHDEPGEGRAATSLTVDHRGKVWSAGRTLDLGIVWHGPDGARQVAPPGGVDPDTTWVAGLHALEEGHIALVTADQGVFLRDEQGGWQRPAGFPEGRIWDSTHTPGGLLVVGDDGLSRLRQGRWAHGLHSAAGLPDEGLLAVVGDEGGRVWVASDGWVGSISGVDGRVLVADESLELRTHLRLGSRGPLLLPDGSGGVWVGSAGLLLRIDASGEFERIDGGFGLAGEGVNDLLRDRDGNAWIATSRGLSRVPSLRFLNWDQGDGLLGAEVTALLPHPDGWLIIGHNQGLTRLDESGVTPLLASPSRFTHYDDTRVLDLALEADGTLWVARARGGLQSLATDRTLRHHPFGEPAEDGFSDIVSGVAFDRHGTLWIGSGGGLWKRPPGGPIERVTSPLLDGQEYVRRVFPRGDDLWIATESHGALRLRDGVWTRYTHPTDPLANSIYAIHEEPSGQVLVGTKAGLLVIEGDQLVRPPQPALSITQPVYFLQPESLGRLWIGTQVGLSRVDMGGRRDYGEGQGLPGGEVNRAASCVDAQGRVWFGTVGGLSLYQERHDHDARAAPTVWLGSAEDGSQTYSLASELVTAAGKGDLSFRFGAITFLDDGRVHYQYRLDGHDEDWVDAPSQAKGEARYVGLAPGRYDFRVRARASRGPWSPASASAPIVLTHPWWKQTWFRGLVGALALALALGVARHVNQRRRADELERLVEQRTQALSAAEQRYREMFHKNIMAQILVSPADGRVRAANPAAEREWEVHPHGLDGRPLTDLLHQPPAGVLEGLLSVHAGDASSATAQRRAADGSLRQLELEACAYDLDGVLAVHLSVRDITERLAVEAQLTQAQKMESVGRLAGGVAHDFNNMLTAVLGHAEQARRELDDHAVADEHLTELMSAARRGAELTSQLLGFAREQPTRPQVLSPGQFASSLRSLLHRVVRDDVVLDVVVDPAAGNVDIDPIQLEQVLINLVVNGADAMPDGGPLVVSVSSGTPDATPREGSPSEDWVRLSVSDAGTGMLPEITSRIFEPFFTTKPQGRGTGLGLATCHGIMRQNGGLIEVDSQFGSGSTFHVMLPRVDQPVAAVVVGETTPKPPEAQPPCAPATILLVEDEEIVRMVAATALRRQGHEIIEAADGREALALEQEYEHTIDLLLTDVIMPGMSGRELAERLLERRAGLCVLYTSGYTADALPDLELRPGSGDLLPKPYRLEELQAAVDAALASRRATASA